jgi:hypothetical protein
LEPKDSAFSQFNAPSIIFFECNVSEFSSNVFLGIPGQATDVVFQNSILSLVNENHDLENVKLQSILFSNVQLDKCKDDWIKICPAFFQFLNISTTKDISFVNTSMNFNDLQEDEWGIDIRDSHSVKFERCNMTKLQEQSIRAQSTSITFDRSNLEFVRRGAIVIPRSENVTFYKTNVHHLQKEGIKATADNVNLIDSYLKEPQRMALSSLVGIHDSSLLTLKNLTLDNPARGALITQFQNGMMH